MHTAAASNLGQMLQRLCAADSIPLVNIVRSEEQVELLKSMGAEWVLNSQREHYMKELIEALTVTGATLAFDAIGGGRGVNRILTAMEIAAAQRGPGRGTALRNPGLYIWTAGSERHRANQRVWLGMVGQWLVTYAFHESGRA